MRIHKYPINRPTRRLLPHQKPILRYMMTTNTPALFIDMRLGKTILTIEYAIRKGLHNVLVVAPKSAFNSWEKELNIEGLDNYKVSKGKSKEVLERIKQASWVITNPQKLATWPFARRKWDLVVVDESSRIKNARSKYFKTLMRTLSHVPHRLLLSGTPTPESILEAVPQLLFLRGEVLGCKTYWEFLVRYTIKYGYDRLLYKSAKEKLIDLLHSTCYFLSQKKAGVAQRCVRKQLLIPKNDKQIALYRQLRNDFEMDVNGKHYETECILATLTWACRIAGGLLDGELLNEKKFTALFNTLQRTSGSVVVWFRFNEELHYAHKKLSSSGITCAAYYGDVSVEERKQIENDFQKGLYKVLLLQVKTGLYALDLSTADTAIYYSNSWSLEERIQSEKRISHPKKKSTLTYIDILTKGWPDTTIYNALKHKDISAKLIWERREYE